MVMITVFFVAVAPVYWFVSGEIIGTVALLLTLAFFGMLSTYFSIQFKGVNDKGFGDYADGFSPSNAAGSIGVQVPGCAVADDFAHALGDPKEARLEAALGYLVTGACPSPPAGPSAVEGGERGIPGEGVLNKSPFRENRILRR